MPINKIQCWKGINVSKMKEKKKEINLFLISDCTCETALAISRSTFEHFKSSVKVHENMHGFVGNETRISYILLDVAKLKTPKIVMYSIFDDNLREYLKSECARLKIPCIGILAEIIKKVSLCLDVEKDRMKAGELHPLDDAYFNRIEAINYTVLHDDGQNLRNPSSADIVLIGASRTSKSPTSIYLAYRGYKVINIPFTLNSGIIVDPLSLADTTVIGLTIDPILLINIRKNRLLAMQDEQCEEYVEYEKILEELSAVKNLCRKHGWPLIDVTQRSIEEIAAMVIRLHSIKNKKSEESFNW